MAGASKGINIPITSEGAGFISGVKTGVIAPLKDAQDAIEQLASTNTSASTKIEAGFKAQQIATEQAAAATKAATLVTQQETEKQTEAFGLSNREINAAQKDTVKQGGAVVAQIVSQSVSGFDGTVSSGLSALTNLSSGVAALSTVPEVAAIGGAIAIITSLISGSFQQAEADTKQFKADVSSTTGTLEKMGIVGVDGVTAVDNAIKKMSITTDGSTADLEANKASAEAAGVSWVQYTDALAGNTEAQKTVYAEATKNAAEQTKIIREQQGARTLEAQNARSAATIELNADNSVTSALKEKNSVLSASTKAANDSAKAQKAEAASSTAAANALLDYGTKAQGVFGDLGTKLQTAQDDVNTKLSDAQSKLASDLEDSSGKVTKAVVADRAAVAAASAKADQDSVDSFIAAQSQQLADLQDKKANEIKIYEEFGPQAAAALIKNAGSNVKLLSNLADATPAQIADIKANYATAGQEAALSYTKEAQAQIKASQLTGNVVLTAPNGSDVVKAIQTQVNNTPAIKVQIQGIAGGKRVI
jgi:hypothetical protein